MKTKLVQMKLEKREGKSKALIIYHTITCKSPWIICLLESIPCNLLYISNQKSVLTSD